MCIFCYFFFKNVCVGVTFCVSIFASSVLMDIPQKQLQMHPPCKGSAITPQKDIRG